MSSLSSRVVMRDRSAGKSPYIAALDLGSSKIACLIAKRADAADGTVRVSGAGHQSSKGIKGGAVVDMDALERSIRLAVETAERAADVRISDVVIGVSGPQLSSDFVKADLHIGGREITATHVKEAVNAAIDSFGRPDRQIMHVTPLGFALDGAPGVKDPHGMFANKLTANVLVISGPSAPLKNIAQCVARAHLNPVAIIATPFAAGLSVLVDDEMEQGATVIDLGGGVTSAASFYEGSLIHLDSIPVGGGRASSDLAQGLGTTFAAAERLKTLHGAVTTTEVAAFDQVDAPRLGEDGRLEAAQTSKAELARILRPRFEEIFEIMEMRLSRASAKWRPLPRRIVITGGASQIPGIRDVAEDVFKSPVRLARPHLIKGLGETYETPAFSAAAGLLKWEASGGRGAVSDVYGRMQDAVKNSGFLKRAALWLKENF